MEETNMPYNDEDIAQITREAREKKKIANIEKQLSEMDIVQAIKAGEVVIDEEVIGFVPVQFYDGQISFCIPESFKVMEEEVRDVKYPSKHQPDTIYTSIDTTINVTVKILVEQEIPADELKDFTFVMRDTLRKMQPGTELLDVGTKEVNGNEIGFFDFISPALDNKMYNLMSIYRVDERVVVSSVNCLKRDMTFWKPIAYAMMETISIKTKSAEEDAN